MALCLLNQSVAHMSASITALPLISPCSWLTMKGSLMQEEPDNARPLPGAVGHWSTATHGICVSGLHFVKCPSFVPCWPTVMEVEMKWWGLMDCKLMSAACDEIFFLTGRPKNKHLLVLWWTRCRGSVQFQNYVVSSIFLYKTTTICLNGRGFNFPLSI